MNDDTSIRNKNTTPVVVGKDFKSSSYNNGDEFKEQTGDHLVVNQENKILSTEIDSRAKIFGEYGRHRKRMRRPPK